MLGVSYDFIYYNVLYTYSCIIFHFQLQKRIRLFYRYTLLLICFTNCLHFDFSSGEQLPNSACWFGAESFVEYAATEAKVAVYTEDEPNGKWSLVNEIIRRYEYR